MRRDMPGPTGAENFRVGRQRSEARNTVTVERTPKLSAEQARDRLRSYLGRQEARVDFEDKDIQDLLEGVRRFKQYNVHEQIEDDPHGTGALGLGEGAFRVPNHNRFPFLFLHDSYIMSKGDQGTEEGRALVESALDKLVGLYKKEGIMPNFSAQSALLVSGPPLFLSMAWEWYQAHPDKDSQEIKDKFQRYMEIGAQEHDHNWNNKQDLTGAIGTNHHVVEGYRWLRRVGDKDCGDAYQASREVRMDRSHARFGGSEDAYLPIDTNAMLLRGKNILVAAADILGVDRLGTRTTAERAQDAKEMRAEINTFMYDPETGNYYDRKYKTNTISDVQTIAAAWSLWAEIPQAEDEVLSVIGSLARLDSGYGLLVTTVEDVPQDVSDEALASIGLNPIVYDAIHQLNRAGNWDAKSWPSELIVTTEGMLNYIRPREEVVLSLENRLAITRFAISKVHDQVRTQVRIFKDTRTGEFDGKLSEKWGPDGKDDNNHYHYEPQTDGIGWGATLAELNITRFLPELYQWEDTLMDLITMSEAQARSALDGMPGGVPVIELPAPHGSTTTQVFPRQ